MELIKCVSLEEPESDIVSSKKRTCCDLSQGKSSPSSEIYETDRIRPTFSDLDKILQLKGLFLELLRIALEKLHAADKDKFLKHLEIEIETKRYS